MFSVPVSVCMCVHRSVKAPAVEDKCWTCFKISESTPLGCLCLCLSEHSHSSTSYPVQLQKKVKCTVYLTESSLIMVKGKRKQPLQPTVSRWMSNWLQCQVVTPLDPPVSSCCSVVAHCHCSSTEGLLCVLYRSHCQEQRQEAVCHC